MTEAGDLHVFEVTPADGLSRFSCRALHRLTGKSQVSVSPARIIVTGEALRWQRWLGVLCKLKGLVC